MALRYYLLFSCVLLCVFGCQKDEVCGEDLVSLEEFIQSNGLTLTELDDTGMFYSIETPGAAERPTLASRVSVNYEGTLTNGAVFDQTTGTPRTFLLGNLIEAWQLGIPLIGQGGKIKLYVPSDLAYGEREIGIICPNSDLIFDIELVNFTN